MFFSLASPLEAPRSSIIDALLAPSASHAKTILLGSSYFAIPDLYELEGTAPDLCGLASGRNRGGERTTTTSSERASAARPKRSVGRDGRDVTESGRVASRTSRSPPSPASRVRGWADGFAAYGATSGGASRSGIYQPRGECYAPPRCWRRRERERGRVGTFSTDVEQKDARAWLLILPELAPHSSSFANLAAQLEKGRTWQPAASNLA
jgi:hypothetical protein